MCTALSCSPSCAGVIFLCLTHACHVGSDLMIFLAGGGIAGSGAGVPPTPGFHSHAIINKTKYLMILGIYKSIKMKS